MSAPPAAPDFARRFPNIASARLGAVAVFASDEFFAPKERMLADAPAVFIPDRYDDHGKWMDGWETRRLRGEGHDYCVVRLAVPARIAGVEIDTSHFTGNYPPAASLGACFVAGDPAPDADWTEIVVPTPLEGDSRAFVAVDDDRVYSHIRLNIFPDGGVARLRVYGQPRADWSARAGEEAADLAALVNGGRAIAWSDSHYGEPNRVLAPGRGADMGDGWETRRRREPGNDWLIIALGHPGEIARVMVDTAHFKGNYPDRCALRAAFVPDVPDEALVTQAMFWPLLMAEQKLQPDREHVFEGAAVESLGPVSHVRLDIVPDGGVSRLRLFGRPARDG